MIHKTHIVIHHSLTEDSGTVSAAAIQRYHMEVQGWRDVGYHAFVELVGDPAKLGRAYAYQALLGRPADEPAAAVKEGGMNVQGLHLCLVGNFDLAAPSEDMLQVAAHRVVIPWMRTWGIPAESIVGHHDFAPYKSCPGTLFDLEQLRRLVR
jgi:hypothetical protein